MKKVGKILRPFRYGPNQIPYDYTVEVTNRFKGLDLIDRMPENYGKIAEKREAKGKGEKERHTHLNTEFQNIARREMKPLSEQCKK